MAIAVESPLLIDTHIWLWLMEGDAELKRGARRVIERSAERRQLRLSIMSVWEVSMLSARGRIHLAKPIANWVESALVQPGPLLEPLTPEIAIAGCHLPAGFRSDPTDEIIIATARITGATLLTRDRRILAYAEAGHMNAIAA